MAARLNHNDYTIAWIAVLPIEAEAALAVLDKRHNGHFEVVRGDDYIYIGGDINGHNIVVATWPEGQNYGVGAASALVNQVKARFKNIWFALLVGIAAGLPNLSAHDPTRLRDIRLGDVLICVPNKASTGIIQYDLGKDTEAEFLLNGRQAETPAIVRAAIGNIRWTKKRPYKKGNEFAQYLEALQQTNEGSQFHCPNQDKDQLFATSLDAAAVPMVVSRNMREESERTQVWYGNIGSGNSMMRNPQRRDELRDKYDLIGLEMEAAGVMNTLPTGVIRGVCDYADEQKNDDWQAYAAAVAAVYAKGILYTITPANERSQREILPDSTCPFSRDINFINRKDVFDKLDEILVPTAEYRWAVLYGLGGIGKSQIAIEYTYRIRKEDPSVWVFWIYANSIESVKQSFRTAAERLCLTGHEDPKADIPSLLERWLSDRRNGPWLVVLDNADDADVLRKSGQHEDLSDLDQSRPLLSYIPQRSYGRVLLTSRDKHTAFALSPTLTSLISVGPMGEMESLALLRSRTGHRIISEKYDKELVSILEYVPLAISQAGSFIQQQGEMYSVSEYLAEFRASELNQTMLLNQQSYELGRESQMPNSVLLAWEISFRQLEKRSIEAVNLLCLMSVLYRQNIPLELVRMYEKSCTRGALNLLEAFSFITVSHPSKSLFSEDEKMITLHRLIQIATRKCLQVHGQLTHWRTICLARVSNLFPSNGQYEYRGHCEALFLHAREALRCDLSNQKDIESNRGILLEKLAWYDMVNGDYSQAVEKARNCDRIYRSFCHGNDVIISRGMSTLASAYSYQGHWDEAEQLEVQVMETRKAKLGAGDPDTLISIANLASTYRNQGRWDEAEQLEVPLMEKRKATLGTDHPDTLTSMANLASTYWKQGRWKEAEQLEVQVMETSKTKLKLDHPDTLESMTNLASTYRIQGRWKEAEHLELQVVEIRKTKLGLEHPDTLTSITNLASTYSDQGRWEEAEQLLIQVMKMRDMKLGIDHPDSLNSMANLASTYWEQGRWTEAEQLEVQVMETRKATLGVSHPDTLTSIANLASTYSDQGRWEEAEQLESHVTETRKTKLGLEHPDTLTSIANLASTYSDQGRWEDAEQLQIQVMEMMKRRLGMDHPYTLTSRANLASTYSDQGRWKEAEQLEVKVMNTRKIKLGSDHPDTLAIMANLASTYRNQGRYKKAERLELQVVEKTKTKLGINHLNTLNSMTNLASTYWRQGRLKEAEQLEFQVMQTKQTKLGMDHPETLTSMGNLASTYQNQRRWEDAEQLEVQVLETRRVKLGMDHPYTLTSMSNLAITYMGSGRANEAISLMKQVVQGRTKKLGRNHPYTIGSQKILSTWKA